MIMRELEYLSAIIILRLHLHRFYTRYFMEYSIIILF